MGRKCSACDNKFPITAIHPHQKYCSRRCYIREWARRKRGWSPPQETSCIICFKKFVPDVFHPHKKVCSPRCSKRLDYINHRSEYITRAKHYIRYNRKKVNSYFREYRKQKPEKAAARSAVGYALVTGRLIRPTHCHKCGRKCSPEGHHHRGYDRKLDVVWLCKSCHRLAHIKTCGTLSDIK